MVATVFILFLLISEQHCKVRLISEISEFSYLALGQIRKLRDFANIFLGFRNDLNSPTKSDFPLGVVGTVFKLLFTVSEQRRKFSLISEISEFSYLASGQIPKLGNLVKIFLSFRNDLNCPTKSDFP